MPKMQYVIHNKKTKFNLMWDKALILFDTKEEAEEFISHFPEIENDENAEIKLGIYFSDHKINYKDLVNLEDYKEAINE